MSTNGMVIAGRVGMVYRGMYSASKSYSKLDAVLYQNSMYIAKKDSTGILPTDTEYWFLSITGQVGTAESVSYDGTESGLTANNVQAAIDEIVENGGGGAGGTVNYNELENKPSIGGVTLQGNNTLSDLGIQPEGDYAPIESPVLTGTPKAPTPPDNENSTQIATTAYVKKLISNLINGAPETLDTLKEIADALGENDDAVQALNAAIGNKVDKVAGKGLSANDYTTAEKNKLSGIAAGAEINVQSDWNDTNTSSDAFIKNKPQSLPASDVYEWAKAPQKPTYTASEVGATTQSQVQQIVNQSKVTPTNNLLATVPGSPLDAVQGKVLDDKVTALNDNLKSVSDGLNSIQYGTISANFTQGGKEEIITFQNKFANTPVVVAIANGFLAANSAHYKPIISLGSVDTEKAIINCSAEYNITASINWIAVL